MKKPRYLAAVLLIVLLVFSIVGCGKQAGTSGTTGGQSSEPITLKFAYATAANSYYGVAYEYFAKAIQEESKGTLKVQTFPAGSLITDAQVAEAVSQGTVDISHFMVAYIDPTVKEMTPFEVPGAYPGDKWQELEKATHPILDKILAKYNIHYLGSTENGVITFANKKVGKPIQSPDDLKGRAVRASGKWGAEAVKLWGGSPVTVPLADLPNALQLGTIDVSYTGWVITGPLKLYEMAPNVTMTELQEGFSGLVMSDKAWKKLSPDQQAAITRAAQKWMDFTHQQAAKAQQDFVDTVTKSGGKLYTLTADENAAFKKVTSQLMEQVKPIAGAEGAELISAFESIK